jgi:cellobiose phosphorylase
MAATATDSRSARSRLRSDAGLSAEFTQSGALRRLDVDGRSLLLYPASELEAGLTNLYLRLFEAEIKVCPLLGPASGGRMGWTEHGPVVTGRWQDLDYRVCFRFAHAIPAWFWHVAVTNRGSRERVIDVVCSHDIALTGYDAVRTNEYYVSQYLDLTPIATAKNGIALAVRQNMPGPSAPWVLIGSLCEGTGWGTDALQLGSPSGVRLPPGLLAGALPDRRLQHEHTLVLLQDRPTRLRSGDRTDRGFFGIYRADHPPASSDEDAIEVAAVLDQPEARAPRSEDGRHSVAVEPTRFCPAALLRCRDLADSEITPLAGPGLHHAERENGRLLSFFTDAGTHVVLAAKERAVLRPHGHILRTGNRLVPEEDSLTSTAWMAGIFHSQVTQGHVALNRILSTKRGYLSGQRACGLRIFVDATDSPTGWALLDQPSAWAVAADQCTWWYRHESGLIEVSAAAPASSHELRLRVRVVEGEQRHLLICANVAFGDDDGQQLGLPPISVDASGVTVAPPPDSVAAHRFPDGSFRLAWPAGSAEHVEHDEILFLDGRSRNLPWVTVRTSPTADFRLTLTARLSPGAAPPRPTVGESWPDEFWQRLGRSIRLVPPPASPVREEVEHLDAILPWFAQNALVHYLAPRGLEQFSGGAWGTRDVCQGPVGLLIALDELPALRDLLIRVLSAQDASGVWPQWFEFLPGTPESGRPKAHGDVIFWPLLALGEYLTASGDGTLLEERLPYFSESGATAKESVLDHVRRALARIAEDTIPGTPLPAYGLGDWNDSLRPADPRLAANLCSTWTVTLQVYALRTLANALRAIADSLAADRQAAAITTAADAAERIVAAAAEAMGKLLVRDGLLAGYGLFHEDGSVEPLVHPGDRRTGLHYGLLQISSAISADLLDRDAATAHLAVVEEHLMGPDGARLFDRPASYRGGPMEVFERAEAATFFGREIGLMYMHAHLRYAEALARYGDGRRFLAALALANPIGLGRRVKAARLRQSTCYFTSSDAAFADRYQAAEQYQRVLRDDVPLEAGWRVYSSGPGIFLRLIVESLLGLRRRPHILEVDPVLDPALDGLVAHVPIAGVPVAVHFHVGARGVGPLSVRVNGVPLAIKPLSNPYRPPGVAIEMTELRAQLRARRNMLDVEVA